MARYMLSVIERRTGWALRRAKVEAIVNFRRIDDRLLTGGQPDARQIVAAARAGVTTVINLAPHDSANALSGEAELVQANGMRYVHIPVNFKAPTEADFSAFAAAMGNAAGERLLVHCAANMRVSAFVYRYRTEILGVAEPLARADLSALWEPNADWAPIIFRVPPSASPSS